MRIDAHTHIGLNGHSATDLIRTMDSLHIDRSCLLTWEEEHPPLPSLHIPLGPEPVLEAAARYPDRFIPFYAPDPQRTGATKHLLEYAERGIMGCGELKVSLQWSDKILDPYLRTLNELNRALVIHMEEARWQYIQEGNGPVEWLFERLMNDKFNGVSRHYIGRFAESTGILRKKIHRNRLFFPGILFDFEGLEKRLAAFPGIRFVGHGPGFWNALADINHPRYIHQRGPIRNFGIIDALLERYDNLYCDLSGHSGYNAMRRDPGQAKRFLEKHAGKVMYGSDNTGLPLIQLLNSLGLGDAPMKQIMGLTAEKVLLRNRVFL